MTIQLYTWWLQQTKAVEIDLTCTWLHFKYSWLNLCLLMRNSHSADYGFCLRSDSIIHGTCDLPHSRRMIYQLGHRLGYIFLHVYTYWQCPYYRIMNNLVSTTCNYSIASDIPETVPLSTVNRQCSSGLQAFMSIAGTSITIQRNLMYCLCWG